jgi:addiction module RelE/StbE family toxin
MYAVFFTRQAQRLFKKLPPDVKEKLKADASTLSDNPLSGEPLHGSYRAYRSLHTSFKGTAYRIIYQVIAKSSMVVIVLADKRENLYKRLQEMKL